MAQKTKERLKEWVLLAFVACCLLLVGFTWLEGLSGDQAAVPSYYRAAPPAGDHRSPSTSEPAVDSLSPTPLPTRFQQEDKPSQEATGQPEYVPGPDG